MSTNKTKSARRKAYLNAEPVNPVRLSTAIRELDVFFSPNSRHWKEPIPVWLGLALIPQMENWTVLLGEYRRVRAELLVARNHRSRLAYELSLKPTLRCRKRLRPLVRMMLND